MLMLNMTGAPSRSKTQFRGYGFRARRAAPPRNDSVCFARRANHRRHGRARCLALVAKIKCFASGPKHLYKPSRPAPPGGAYHERQDTLARDAMDAVGIERRTRPARTAKPCGPG